MTARITNRPAPQKDGIATAYWEAAEEERLVLQRCDGCERYLFPPRVTCPHCWTSDALGWVESDGRGVVHAFSVVCRPPTPDLNQGRPYVVALIDLVEGVRMMSNVVDCDVADVRVGLHVVVDFDESPSGRLPVFRPAPAVHHE